MSTFPLVLALVCLVLSQLMLDAGFGEQGRVMVIIAAVNLGLWWIADRHA